MNEIIETNSKQILVFDKESEHSWPKGNEVRLPDGYRYPTCDDFVDFYESLKEQNTTWSNCFWTSESFLGDERKAWFFDMSNGFTGVDYKSNGYAILFMKDKE